MTVARAWLAGLMVVLAFPPASLWPLAFLAWSMIAYGFLKLSDDLKNSEFDRKQQRWKGARFLFFYSLSVNLFGFYWLGYTLKEFGRVPYWIQPVLLPVIFSIFSLFSAFVGYGLSYILQRTPKSLAPFTISIVLFAWDLLDLKFFPWHPVMGVGSDKWLLASVYYLQTWGWQLIFIFFVIGAALAYRASNNENLLNIKLFLKRISLLVIVSFLLPLALGIKAEKELKNIFVHRKTVALLQGNIGNYEKKLSKLNDFPTVRNVNRIHRTLLEDAAIRAHRDKIKNLWIFWPETSFPAQVVGGRSSDAKIDLESLTSVTGGLHFIGTYEGEKINWGGKLKDLDYNIVAMVSGNGELIAHYRKNIRIPFGEFVPGDIYFPKIYELLPQVNHFGRGFENTLLAHPFSTGPIFIPVICYEILYSSFMRKFIKEAKEKFPGRDIVLLNPTNDSWYGPTAEPFQHSLMARWKAVSFGVPLIRPTNTGLSQIIAPWGEVLNEGPRDEMWLIWGKLPLRNLPEE